MKFIRNRRQQPTKSFNENDFDIYFKKYIQSYLRWMYEQNPYFFEYLTTVEIVNFFMSEFYHPVWLQLKLNTESLNTMTELTDYIKKYAKNSEQMDMEIPLHPLIDYAKPVVMKDYTSIVISEDYKTRVEDLTSNLNLNLNLKFTTIDDCALLEALKKGK